VRDDADRRRRIVEVVLALGPGEVTTYGDVADVAGYPRRARFVGRVLAPAGRDLTWWRVVAADGSQRASDRREQAQLLRREGVTVVGERVRAAPVGRFSRAPARRRSGP
jgi:methylated-DNA-protein-cysteine methyltransferase-like protein